MRKLLALLLLLGATPAFATTYYAVSGTAVDATGSPLVSPTVSVYSLSTNALATIYSDNSGSSQANPFTAGSDGTYSIYATSGRYRIDSRVGSGTTYSRFVTVPVTTPGLNALRNTCKPDSGGQVVEWSTDGIASCIETPSGGGGGTPGGSSGQIQYNNAGSFGGTSSIALSTVNVTGNGSASRCARFDSSHHLVEASGDCASGDTTLSTPVSVANGGTGAASHTAHGVLVGEGTSAVTATSAGTAGQVLTSNGASADPTFQTTTALVYPTPPSTSGTLFAWYDADDANLKFSHINGHGMWNWGDLSGGARPLSHPEVTGRPTLARASQNSRNGIVFGSGAYFMAGGQSQTFTAGSAYIVINPTTVAANGRFLTLGPNTGADYTDGLSLLLTSGDGTSWRSFRTGLANDLDIAGPSITTGTAVIVGVRWGSGTAKLRINGGSETTDTYTSSLSFDGSFIGLGSQPAGGDNTNAFKVYEVLLYSSNLSDGDDTTVRNYLNSKWGVF